MKIGFYDSGAGGLTVLKEALKRIPDNHFIYYGDTKNVPYGKKSAHEVIGYAKEAAKYLLSKNVDCIVIACNTASSAAGETIRKEVNIPVICMEPAINLAMKNNTENKRILVMATNLTLKLEKYKQLKNKLNEELIDEIAAPKLVEFAEKFNINNEEIKEYLKQLLSPYDLSKYSFIVLGCTHFIYFKDIIETLIDNKVQIIDGNIGTINHLTNVLNLNNKGLKGTQIDIHLTGGASIDYINNISDYLEKNKNDIYFS